MQSLTLIYRTNACVVMKTNMTLTAQYNMFFHNGYYVRRISSLERGESTSACWTRCSAPQQ